MDLVMVLNDHDSWNSLDVTTFNPPSPVKLAAAHPAASSGVRHRPVKPIDRK